MTLGGSDETNPMTHMCARAAMRFGATYRLIDFPLANCINSNVKRVFVLTQWNSYSLNQHITKAYPQDIFGGTFGKTAGFIDVLPAFQSPKEQAWCSVGCCLLQR